MEEENGELKYNASSPDELALINFAAVHGYVYKGLDNENNMILEIKGSTILTYKLIYTLEFNSTRQFISFI